MLSFLFFPLAPRGDLIVAIILLTLLQNSRLDVGAELPVDAENGKISNLANVSRDILYKSPPCYFDCITQLRTFLFYIIHQTAYTFCPDGFGHFMTDR